ncbi:monocyte to macrophage differentiation factor-like [Paramacrobiotus metropolitanus]|uniref:monocyte to macrophage differentiation factor-like n=1 Tax=Paramacrobiotus metropolitanus TaxID=2943436 RepID=UPI002445E1EB|nr:monocyte to macrophage differentiation factor-like [Paramacrobiotus metropolitanus]
MELSRRSVPNVTDDSDNGPKQHDYGAHRRSERNGHGKEHATRVPGIKRNWRRFRNRRACPGEAYEPTDIEHVANICTHAISIIPAMCAMGYLLLSAPTYLHAITAVIYGCSLIALFGVSTAFHSACYFGMTRRVKFTLHICDRATIYAFIACSYSPWLLLKDAELYVLVVFFVLWFMVFGGAVYQYLFHEKYKHFETFLYLFMGIIPGVICVPGMADSRGIMAVAQGGAVYVLGVVFFKMDGVIPCAHAIWHLFVVVGASWHFLAVAHYLYAGNLDIPLAAEQTIPN